MHTSSNGGNKSLCKTGEHSVITNQRQESFVKQKTNGKTWTKAPVISDRRAEKRAVRENLCFYMLLFLRFLCSDMTGHVIFFSKRVLDFSVVYLFVKRYLFIIQLLSIIVLLILFSSNISEICLNTFQIYFLSENARTFVFFFLPSHKYK